MKIISFQKFQKILPGSKFLTPGKVNFSKKTFTASSMPTYAKLFVNGFESVSKIWHKCFTMNVLPELVVPAGATIIAPEKYIFYLYYFYSCHHFQVSINHLHDHQCICWFLLYVKPPSLIFCVFEFFVLSFACIKFLGLVFWFCHCF